MRLCELVGLPVLDVKEMRKRATVCGWLFDECGLRAACLLVDGARWYEGALALPFEGVFALGRDAVLMNSPGSILHICDSAGLVRAAQSKITGVAAPVFMPDGTRVGFAEDFVVNERGVVTRVLMGRDGAVESNRLIRVGDAVLVSDVSDLN